MNALTEHTTVMRMLSVTIPRDLTSARVKMDVVEMELGAKVTVILSFYLISPY